MKKKQHWNRVVCMRLKSKQLLIKKSQLYGELNYFFFLLKRVTEPKNHKTDWITYILIAGAWFISIFMAHKFRSVCTHMDSSCYFNQPTRIFHLSYTLNKSMVYLFKSLMVIFHSKEKIPSNRFIVSNPAEMS